MTNDYNIDEYVNIFISLIQSFDKPITEESINTTVYTNGNEFLKMFYNHLKTMDKKTMDKVSKIIKSRMTHKIENSNSVIRAIDYKPWFKEAKIKLSLKYWDRYKKYLLNRGFPKKVVESMDDVTDDLVDYVGNPQGNNEFQRRGLIIGDVQSGKTANFIGMMCKAVDSGYKLVVVLTGTDNKLRTQTQERIDEGLLGYNSDFELGTNREYVGVGNGFGDKLAPVSITTRSYDFDKKIAKRFTISLDNIDQPFIFVIKKNVSVLDNLIKWLDGLNIKNQNEKIPLSMLIVDDESDYASINTNNEDKNPTKTNEKITNLLDLFEKTSYVGFTATPYANIFINPNTDSEMENSSLFPKDYIYCLDAPSNYIGARNIFGDDDDERFNDFIKTIESEDSILEPNIHKILPLKHKKDSEFEAIPYSLKKAILEFYLINVIRDLWGNNKSHRSMLVNISRYTNVHDKIKYAIDNYTNSLNRSIELYFKIDDVNKWSKDQNMRDLFEVYKEDYREICEDKTIADNNAREVINWGMIKRALYESTYRIKNRVVNQKSKDSFDYSKEKENGLRVIAIGGVALSRGLTLEGLTISYFFRNSQAFDTLMQMGRWFGYRDGYADLCRIWLTDDAQEWYYSINRATEELRKEILRYKDSDLTPLDFGLRVRSDDNNLIITARNKMRTAKEKLVECTLSSRVIETPYLSISEELNIENTNKTKEFIEKLLNENYKLITNENKKIGFLNVKHEFVVDYLKEIQLLKANINFQSTAIIDFIENNNEKLANWDIQIAEGDGNAYHVDEKIKLNTIKRMIDIKPGSNIVRVSAKRCRVGGPSDGRYGLSQEVINSIKPKRGNKNVSQTDYFESGINRNALLTIYFISAYPSKEIDSEERRRKTQEMEKISKTSPLIALSIGIPNLGINEKKVTYYINIIEQGLIERNMNDFDEDFDDE